MSNGLSRPQLQVTQRVNAQRVVVGGIPGGADATISAVFGLVVWTTRASAWLRVATEAIRRGFAAFIWFRNIPVLGSHEMQ